MKRAFDVCVSAIALVVLFPLFAVFWLLIRWKLGSPCLFTQTRPGFKGKPFTIYKFRTMTTARDETGKLLPDADRLTRFGMFLRSSSIDELPELYNVLKGEMSIVGPRPLMMVYLDRYSAEQARRHDVRPGITGWAQINGRNDISWDDKFKLDVWYVDNWSFWLDIKIIAMTLFKVVKREGISARDHATAPEFLGSDLEKS